MSLLSRLSQAASAVITIFVHLGGAAGIALAFLTALPVPNVEWTPPRLRYVPVALPGAGIVLGAGYALFFVLLSCWEVSAALLSVSMTLFYLALTGGIHMDGLMDACDAVFSRRDRETRLKILTDTHTGAFAVMGCAAILLMRAGIFFELFSHRFSERPDIPFLLALIPIYSRIGAGLLFYLPFAREEGLARTLGALRVPRDRYYLLTACALLIVISLPFADTKRAVLAPLAGGTFLCLYRPYCLKTFGGICGDLMGAFVEVSETLMLLILAGA